jgi:hypothetical protein
MNGRRSNAMLSKPIKTREIWRERIRRWEESGLPAKEFIKLEGISDCSLYQWRKRLRKEAETKESEPRFIELHTFHPSGGKPAEVPVESHTVGQVSQVEETRFGVRMRNSIYLEVPQRFESNSLQRLIQVLEGM